MPRALTQYRVFIGSPGGLDEERTCFHTKLTKFTAVHADERGVVFHPMGWEDTLGGVGRPQALINEDLKRCDYAVFVLHDRWGSPSGGGYTSGTEEEWVLAEELYKQNKIRNIVLFFKAVDPRQMRDPGKQLESVLSFKKRIEEGKSYLFKQYDDITNFADTLEGHLARWLKDHEDAERGVSHSGLVTGGTTAASPTGDLPFAAPSFDYWITEASTLLEALSPDYFGALFCATRAVNAATSDIEWSRGVNSIGIAQLYLGDLDKAIESFAEITQKFGCPAPVPRIGTPTLAGASRLDRSLRIGATGPHVPCKSPVQSHAAFMPDAAWAANQDIPQTRPGLTTSPRFRHRLYAFDTSSAVCSRSSL
jgi:hypothetical protein